MYIYIYIYIFDQCALPTPILCLLNNLLVLRPLWLYKNSHVIIICVSKKLGLYVTYIYAINIGNCLLQTLNTVLLFFSFSPSVPLDVDKHTSNVFIIHLFCQLSTNCLTTGLFCITGFNNTLLKNH